MDINIKVTQRTCDPDSWEISVIGYGFLNWMRDTFGDDENKLWVIAYYGSAMSIIRVKHESIMSMIMLRWT